MDSSPLDQNCVNARNESVLLTAMSPVPNTVLGTQELKNSCQINELIEQKKKKKKSASATLLIIYPTVIVTHIKGQIYIIIHWTTVYNSKRPETFKIPTNIGQVPNLFIAYME